MLESWAPDFYVATAKKEHPDLGLFDPIWRNDVEMFNKFMQLLRAESHYLSGY